jgi:sulfatase maturation enzyme AslB (radical SAM superfamily)
MKDFYCAAPWRGLHINPRGDIKTCCAGDPNMLGNLNTHTVDEILNGTKLQEIRNTIAQGQIHPYCSNCVKAERYGAESERAWHNRSNPDLDYATAGLNYHYPVIVDIRWNITCNLTCNYCSESCSSKWATLKNIPFKSVTRPYYEQVCEFIKNHPDHIYEVALVGGEPLLLPENERLLDVISANTRVILITNMSVDLENNKVFKKLAARRNVGWSMSFDNVGDQFEYVRYGGNWNLLKNNLAIVKDLMKHNDHWGGIHAVYNLYNATRICDLRQFAKEQGLSVLWQNLFQPDCLDPLLHGKEVAKIAAEEIKNFFASGIATEAEQVFFNNALEKYESVTESNVEMAKKFCQHTKNIENKYHTDQQGNFVKLWPELKPLYDLGLE